MRSTSTRGLGPPRPAKSRRQEYDVSDDFPFHNDTFIGLLLKECYNLRHVVGAHALLHTLLEDGRRMFRVTECSLNKALERLCIAICQKFGQSVHPRFWKIAKYLCNQPFHAKSDLRKPHVSTGCMTGDLALVPSEEKNDVVWDTTQERWLAGVRTKTTEPDQVLVDRQRMMNIHILEAIVHHQYEYAAVWRQLPDLNAIFMAMTFARRAASSTTSVSASASTASHFASMAVRYEIDESRTGSAAFKGLRRWRNVLPADVTDLTLAAMWGHRETPRHHQLWHCQRLVKEQGLQATPSKWEDATFLLLIAVMNDFVFAHLPPEDAADAVVTAIYYPQQERTPRQRFDISRIGQALDKPRSPYMHILFPEKAKVPTEVWRNKLQLIS